MTIRAGLAALMPPRLRPSSHPRDRPAGMPNLREGEPRAKDCALQAAKFCLSKLHYSEAGKRKGAMPRARSFSTGWCCCMRTSGSGDDWRAAPSLGNELFGAGSRIDAIEKITSSCRTDRERRIVQPSDGLRAKFRISLPRIVVAEHRLVTEHLKVRHLRRGCSGVDGPACPQPGCGATCFPDLMDGIVPIASSRSRSAAGETGSSGRVAIRGDPQRPGNWNNCNYTKNPTHYITQRVARANETRVRFKTWRRPRRPPTRFTRKAREDAKRERDCQMTSCSGASRR